MRCFLDSNIIISAGLFPNGIPAAALKKALSPPNVAIMCDYSLDEIRRVFKRKFPDKTEDLELFLSRLLFSVEFVTTPNEHHNDEIKIRDVNDRPILRAAKSAGTDILITGDKDFLDSTVTDPKIVTASQFFNNAVF